MESRVVSCEEKKVRQERKWLSGGKMFCNSSEHKDLNTDQTLVLDALLKREKDHPSLSYHLLNSLVEKEKYNYTVHTRFQKKKKIITYSKFVGFPGGSTSKESACKAGDLGSIPGLGRSPGEGNGHPLQYSGLKNSMDYNPQVAKSWTQLSHFHFLSLAY